MFRLLLNQFQWYRKFRGGEWYLFEYYKPPFNFDTNQTQVMWVWRKGTETAGEIEKIGKWILYKIMDTEIWI